MVVREEDEESGLTWRMVMGADEVLEWRRTNGKVGATSSAREVRELDEEDFESDDCTSFLMSR